MTDYVFLPGQWENRIKSEYRFFALEYHAIADLEFSLLKLYTLQWMSYIFVWNLKGTLRKISFPCFEKCNFYIMLKIEELTDFRFFLISQTLGLLCKTRLHYKNNLVHNPESDCICLQII